MSDHDHAHVVETWRPRRWQGLALAIWMAASFVLCVWGFIVIQDGRDPASWHTWVDALHQAIRVFGFEYDGPKKPQEVPVPLLLGKLGALIGVLWISSHAILLLLRERATVVRLLLRAPNIAICGLTGETLQIAAAQKKSQPKLRIAVLATDPASSLAQQFAQNVSRLILPGDASLSQNRSRLRVTSAKQCVYVDGGNDDQTLNIVELLIRGAQLQKQAPEKPQPLIAIFRERSRLSALPPAVETADRQRVDLHWIDPVTTAARVMLDRRPPDHLAPAGPIHVLVVGGTSFSEALILALVRNVYPRARPIRITVMAANAGQFRDTLYQHHPALSPDYPDRRLLAELFPFAQLEFISQEPSTLSATTLEAIQSEGTLTCAYVHSSNDEQTLIAVRRLEQLRERAGYELPIAAYLRRERALPNIVQVVGERDVYSFAPGDRYLGQTLDHAAALHHFAYQHKSKVPALDASIEEHSRAFNTALREWRELQEWQRESNRHVADHIAVKLRVCGASPLLHKHSLSVAQAKELLACLEQRSDDLAELEHRRYCAERILDGWLPVDMAIWNSGAGESADALKRHHAHLASLRLNPTLTLRVNAEERSKDTRLSLVLAWVLYVRSLQEQGKI